MECAKVITNGNLNLNNIQSGNPDEVVIVGAITKKPCTKVRFATEKSALFYIEKLKNTSHRKVLPLRAYLCPFCTCWHLTSNKDRNKEDIDELKQLKEKLKNAELMISNKNEEIRKKKEEVASLQRKLAEHKREIKELKRK